MMGNGLKYKSIFAQIAADQQTQNYADIANQYGRMVRITLDFEPIPTSALNEAYAGLDPILAESIKAFSETVDSIADSSDFKSIRVLVEYMSGLVNSVDYSSAVEFLENLEHINAALIDFGT